MSIAMPLLTVSLAIAPIWISSQIAPDVTVRSYSSPTAPTTSHADTLRLTATPSKVVISEREVLTLALSLRNSTQRSIYVVESNPLADYTIDVRDEQGKQASPTDEGKDLLMRALWLSRRVSVLMKPGDEKRETFELNRIYRMTAGTSYTITTHRSVLRNQGKTRVQLTSNVVKVQITA